MVRLLGLLGLLAGTNAASPVSASHDPSRTATVYVHGFESGGDPTGVYGDDVQEPLLEEIAALVGLPTNSQPGGVFEPNVVTATSYYGSIPPSYYSPQDIAEIEATTAAWGGGLPRYALVLAKYARHVLARSGADQVSFVSASFGSLVVRWLIERNLEDLAAAGRIGRWLSIEGVLCGNWAASQDPLVELAELVEAPPIDVAHMHYGWIEAHLAAPRTRGGSPWYAGILLGQFGSTDDRLNERALTAAMLATGEFQPNDGVQGLWDARFGDVPAAARLLGLPPTWSVFHNTHTGIRDDAAARAQAAIFCTQSRRVTITMTRARVDDIHEPSWPFLDWRPAEVVFESRVYSGEMARRWGVTGAVSELTVEGGATPLRRFVRDGEVQGFSHVAFDDLALASETSLDLELWAEEIDLDLRYGVVETAIEPHFQFLGGGWLAVPVAYSGSRTFQAADWNADISVEVFDYPFATPTGAGDPGAGAPPRSAPGLLVAPNPFGTCVRIFIPSQIAASGSVTPGATSGIAALQIYDVTGRLVRTLRGPLDLGLEWDGRDAAGRLLPAGVYYHRLATRAGLLGARSLLVR